MLVGRRRPETLLCPFTTHYAYRAADFQDALSNTIGVSERLQGDWLDGSTKAGGDYFLHSQEVEPTMDAAAAIAACSALPPDAAVESRGGETWFLSGFHCTNYSHCVTPNRPITNCAMDQEMEPLHASVFHSGVFPASSDHGSGVNVVFMDGNVRHTRNSISLRVWRALGTRSNDEAACLVH